LNGVIGETVTTWLFMLGLLEGASRCWPTVAGTVMMR
jgi:hypothetical protein